MTAVLECSQLNVRYAGHRALNDVSVRLAGGEMLGIVGPNGAGKSTLVNALAGWSRGETSCTGQVSLAGEDMARLSAHQRARAGLMLVPEGKNTFGALSVEENLALVSRPKEMLHRFACNEEDIQAIFPRLGERRAHTANQLSGGERQMLAIACALLAGPKALLLDEPSIGLAPRLISELLSSLRLLVDQGLAVLLVEQNVRAAIKVVDRVAVLERGALVMQGTADEFRNDARLAEAYFG